MATSKKITVGIDFDVNTKGLNEVKKKMQEIQKMTAVDYNSISHSTGGQKELDKLKASAKELEDIFERCFDTTTGTYNLSKLNKELNKVDLVEKSKEFNKLGAAGRNAFLEMSAKAMEMNKKVTVSNKALDAMFKNFKKTLGWTISSSVVNNLGGSILKAYGYSKKLDKSLNNIRIVTKQSNEQMKEFAKYASQSAAKLAKSTTDYTDAALIYYQQGLADEDVKARTDTTLKTANVTGQSASAVSEQLTAVWNGYKVSANEAEKYVDKLAAVAASTAADLEELSTGMSKVASAAATTGVDIDQLSAQMSTIISVTRQAPESVGTALKTIYARLGDLDISGNLGDVSGKLRTIGVDVLDSSGDLRDMGDIIEEVAGKWDTMTAAQKNGVAIAMAGKRQYNNLFALFENWDMYKSAKETSENSLGELQTQQDIFLDSMEAKMQQLSQAGENVIDSLFDIDSVKPFVEGLTDVVNKIADFIDVAGGGKEVLLGLSGILSTMFSKNIGAEANRIANNIKMMYSFSADNKAHAQLVNTFGKMGMSAEQSSNLAHMTERRDQLAPFMSDKDQEKYTNLIKQQSENYLRLNEIQEERATLIQAVTGEDLSNLHSEEDIDKAIRKIFEDLTILENDGIDEIIGKFDQIQTLAKEGFFTDEGFLDDVQKLEKLEQQLNKIKEKFYNNNYADDGGDPTRLIEEQEELNKKAEEKAQKKRDAATEADRVTETTTAKISQAQIQKNMIDQDVLSQQMNIDNWASTQKSQIDVKTAESSSVEKSTYESKRQKLLDDLYVQQNKVKRNEGLIRSNKEKGRETTGFETNLKKAEDEVKRLNEALANLEKQYDKTTKQIEKDAKDQKKAIEEQARQKKNTAKTQGEIDKKTQDIVIEEAKNEQQRAKNEAEKAKTEANQAKEKAKEHEQLYGTNQQNMNQYRKTVKDMEEQAKKVGEKTKEQVDNSGLEEIDKKAKEVTKDIKNTGEAMEDLDKKADFGRFAQGVSQAIGGISQLAFGMQSLNTVFDENATFSQKFMAAMMGLPMVTSGAISMIGGLKTGLEQLAFMTAVSGEAAEAAGKKGVLAVLKVQTALGPLYALLLVATIAIVAMSVAGYALYKSYNKQAEAAEKAQKAAAEHAETLRTLQDRYNNLKTSIDNLSSAEEVLKDCKKGTVEWTEAVMDLNTQILELIQQYPNLASAVTTDKDGVMHINQGVLENELQEQQKIILNQTRATAASQAKAREEQLKLDLETKGRSLNLGGNTGKSMAAASIFGLTHGGIGGAVMGALADKYLGDQRATENMKTLTTAVKENGQSILTNTEALQEQYGFSKDLSEKIAKNSSELSSLTSSLIQQEEAEKDQYKTAAKAALGEDTSEKTINAVSNLVDSELKRVAKEQKAEWKENYSNIVGNANDKEAGKMLAEALGYDPTTVQANAKGSGELTVTAQDGTTIFSGKTEDIWEKIAEAKVLSDEGFKDLAERTKIDEGAQLTATLPIGNQEDFEFSAEELQSVQQGTASKDTIDKYNRILQLSEDYDNSAATEFLETLETSYGLSKDLWDDNISNLEKVTNYIEKIKKDSSEDNFLTTIFGGEYKNKEDPLLLSQALDAYKNAFDALGWEGRDVVENLFNKDEFVDRKKELIEAFNNAGDLQDPDWLNKFKKNLADLGFSTEEIERAVNKVSEAYNNQQEAMKDSVDGQIVKLEELEKKILTIKEILGEDGIKLGDIITDEQFKQLDKYIENARKFFTRTAGGWAFIGDENEFNNEIKQSEETKNLTSQFTKKRKIGSSLSNENIKELTNVAQNTTVSKDENDNDDYTAQREKYLSASSALIRQGEENLDNIGVQRDSVLNAQRIIMQFNPTKYTEEDLQAYNEAIETLNENLNKAGEIQSEFEKGSYNNAAAMEISANNAEDYADLMGKVFTGQTSLGKAKKAYNNILRKEADATKTDVKVLETQATLLRKNHKELKLSKTMALQMVANSNRQTKAIDGLNTVLKEHKKVLSEGNKDTPAYAEAITQLTEQVKLLFNSEDIDEDWVVENLDKIKDAAKGDQKAILELGSDLAKLNMQKLEVDPEFKEKHKKDVLKKSKKLLDDIQEYMSKQDLTVPFKIDDEGTVKDLNNVLNQLGDEADEFIASLSQMNVSIDVKKVWSNTDDLMTMIDDSMKELNKEIYSKGTSEKDKAIARGKLARYNKARRQLIIDKKLTGSNYSFLMSQYGDLSDYYKYEVGEGGLGYDPGNKTPDEGEGKKKKKQSSLSASGKKGDTISLDKMQKHSFESQKDVLAKINRLIEQQGQLIEKINDENDRLYGPDAIKNNLNKIEALKEENKLLDKRIETQQKAEKVDEKALKRQMIKSGYTRQQAKESIAKLRILDSDGNVVGYNMSEYNKLTKFNKQRNKLANEANKKYNKSIKTIKDLVKESNTIIDTKEGIAATTRKASKNKKKVDTSEADRAIKNAFSQRKESKEDLVEYILKMTKIAGKKGDKKQINAQITKIMKKYQQIREKKGKNKAENYYEEAYTKLIRQSVGSDFYRSMKNGTQEAQSGIETFQSQVEERAQAIYDDYCEKIENLNEQYDVMLSLVEQEYELRKEMVKQEEDFLKLREDIKSKYLSETAQTSDRLGIYDKKQSLAEKDIALDKESFNKYQTLLLNSAKDNDELLATMQKLASSNLSSNKSTELASELAKLKEENGSWNQSEIQEKLKETFENASEDLQTYFDNLGEQFNDFFSLQEMYLNNIDTYLDAISSLASSYDRAETLLEMQYGKRRSADSGIPYVNSEGHKVVGTRLDMLQSQKDLYENTLKIQQGEIELINDWIKDIDELGINTLQENTDEKISAIKNRLSDDGAAYSTGLAKVEIWQQYVQGHLEAASNAEDVAGSLKGDLQNINNTPLYELTAAKDTLKNALTSSKLVKGTTVSKIVEEFFKDGNQGNIENYLDQSGINEKTKEDIKTLVNSTMETYKASLQGDLNTKIKSFEDAMNDELTLANGLTDDINTVLEGLDIDKISDAASAATTDFKSLFDLEKQADENTLANLNELTESMTIMEEKRLELQQKGLETAEASAQTVEELGETIKEIVEETLSAFDQKLVTKLTGSAFGVDDLESSWNKWQTRQNAWIDEVNKEYEIDKLSRAVDKEYDSLNGNIKAQEKLKTIMGEQLDILEKKNKMSQYDLDRAYAIFNLTKAQIALEEARNNKSKLKLRRDSSGNYSYQYVADLNDIADKEQAVKDAENNIWNLDKNEINSSVSSMISGMKSMMTMMSDTANEYGSDSVTFATHAKQNMKDWLLDNASEYYDFLNGSNNVFDQFDRNKGYKKEDVLGAFYALSQGKELKDLTTLQQNIISDWAATGGLPSQEVMTTLAPVLSAMNGESLKFDANGQISDENAETLLKKIFGENYSSDIDVLSENIGEYLKEFTELNTDISTKIYEKVKDISKSITSIQEYITETLKDTSLKTIIEDIINGQESAGYIEALQEALDKLVNTPTLDAISSNAVGGELTGWGTEGKIGILHQNEVIVNSDLVQKMKDFFNNNALNNTVWALERNTQLDNLLQSVSESNRTTLDQNVNIKAEFPNVKEHTEIEQALNNLVNRASQYALKPSLV